MALVDSELVAVLVRLDDEMHGADRGGWFLEVGFGPFQEGPSSVVFQDLDEAESWIEKRMPKQRSG